MYVQYRKRIGGKILCLMLIGHFYDREEAEAFIKEFTSPVLRDIRLKMIGVEMTLIEGDKLDPGEYLIVRPEHAKFLIVSQEGRKEELNIYVVEGGDLLDLVAECGQRQKPKLKICAATDG